MSTLPAKLGRYDVLGRLAAGGMAEILLAALAGPSAFERVVVIKRILPHLAENQSFVDMFLDEAHIVAGIRHPAVVQVHELVREEGELFLVLEYVEGESVGGLMRRLWSCGETLSYALAAHLVAEACSGLHAAHELKAPDGTARHVVHRDVSPQNVMITYGGDVKVLDFGIAKAKDRASRTEAGQVKGKFEYMSPEQCRGRPLDRRSDLFALGILLYELSVGRRLFRRDSALSTFEAICEGRLPSPKETRADYPDALAAICQKALARKADDRYATALEMRRDLVAVARKLGSGDVEDEALSKLLHRLFPDRIAEKEEMLRRLRAGTSPERIPEAEVDTIVEIPNVVDTTIVHADEAAVASASLTETTPSTRRASRASLVVGGVGVLSALAMVAVIAFARSRDKEQVPTNVASTPPPPAISPSPSVVAPPLGSVHLQIESTPKGARVLVAGAPRGTTPITLDLARGAVPVVVEISRKSFVTIVERVTPNADQKLVVHLQPAKPTAFATPKGASSTPAAAPTPSIKIERFD